MRKGIVYRGDVNVSNEAESARAFRDWVFHYYSILNIAVLLEVFFELLLICRVAEAADKDFPEGVRKADDTVLKIRGCGLRGCGSGSGHENRG
jgi:hypothetical protein